MQLQGSMTEDLGQLGCRNSRAELGEKALGTFSNSMEAVRAYDVDAKTMYTSRAHLNFLAGLDSMITSNYFEVGENKDAIEDITSVSPNVMNEEGGGELRADSQYSVVANTNTFSSTIHEDLTCPFMDDDELMFDLDSIPELFNDNYFENLGYFSTMVNWGVLMSTSVESQHQIISLKTWDQ